MSRILRINNLSNDTTVEDLRILFKGVEVIAAKISREKTTGESRGFGFVKIKSNDAARSAISTLNGRSLNGRPVRVVAVPSPAKDVRKPGVRRTPPKKD